MIVNSSARIEAYDPLTGALLWHAGSERQTPIPSAVFADGLIYLSRGYRNSDVLAIRPGGRGDVTAAREGYASVVPTDNWYAVYSAARLSQPFAPNLKPLTLDDAQIALLGTEPGFVRAHELLLCQLDNEAGAEWRATFDALKPEQQAQSVGLAAHWSWRASLDSPWSLQQRPGSIRLQRLPSHNYSNTESRQIFMRPDWDSYFMKIAYAVSERSTCDRAMVGCVLVMEKRILTTGFNGSPMGQDHCDEVGHLIVDGHCVRTIHAETNAIIQAALHGVSTRGATCYVTHLPCINCTKALINAFPAIKPAETRNSVL